jgi:hypothetical protein
LGVLLAAIKPSLALYGFIFRNMQAAAVAGKHVPDTWFRVCKPVSSQGSEYPPDKQNSDKQGNDLHGEKKLDAKNL